MAYEIKFLSLQKPELAYEILIRGGTPADSVAEMRKQIVKLAPDYPSEDILVSGFDVAVDLKEVCESIIKAESNIKTYNSKQDSSLLNRTGILICHIYHRLSRIEPDSQRTVSLLDDYKQRFQVLHDFVSMASKSNSVRGEPLKEDGNSQQGNAVTHISVSCERDFSNDFNKLKFNGETCVREFIQRVDEFITARNIPFSRIFSMATEIFTDKALHWFRFVKDGITSWEELRRQLKQDFDRPDFDRNFKKEIEARTQGINENITIYISVMAGMFSRLSRPLSEEEKLDIILHNIRPCYANIIASAGEIKDISTLQTLCKTYENVKSRYSSFREPPQSTTDTMAPEFAYQKLGSNSLSPNSNNFNKNNRSYVHAMSAKVKFCPRCRVDTHNLRNCTAERKLVCFRCGKPNFRFHDCPDCNKPIQGQPKN